MTSDAPSGKQPQTLKPFTAAKKLGVHLPATPAEFQTTPVTREAFAELSTNPPEWLSELRRTGPHPRPVVAQKLGISTSGLARAGVDDVMTTEQIHALLDEMPDWLRTERGIHADVREEELRVKERNAGREVLRKEREAREAAEGR
jgi:hypothetical protein